MKAKSIKLGLFVKVLIVKQVISEFKDPGSSMQKTAHYLCADRILLREVVFAS